MNKESEVRIDGKRGEVMFPRELPGGLTFEAIEAIYFKMKPLLISRRKAKLKEGEIA